MNKKPANKKAKRFNPFSALGAHHKIKSRGTQLKRQIKKAAGKKTSKKY